MLNFMKLFLQTASTFFLIFKNYEISNELVLLKKTLKADNILLETKINSLELLSKNAKNFTMVTPNSVELPPTELVPSIIYTIDLTYLITGGVVLLGCVGCYYYFAPGIGSYIESCFGYKIINVSLWGLSKGINFTENAAMRLGTFFNLNYPVGTLPPPFSSGIPPSCGNSTVLLSDVKLLGENTPILMGENTIALLPEVKPLGENTVALFRGVAGETFSGTFSAVHTILGGSDATFITDPAAVEALRKITLEHKGALLAHLREFSS